MPATALALALVFEEQLLTDLDRPQTQDRLLNGRVTLIQPAAGYRAGMDAALLAAACDAAPGASVLDAGCGVGAVMICAAVRRPGVRFIGVDDDPAAVDLAMRNIALNGLQDRLDARRARIAAPRVRLEEAPFDAVLSNPPFFDDPGQLRGPAPGKTAAWIVPEGLAAWIDHLLRMLKEGGRLTLIHRADRLGDILAALGGRAGAVQVRPVSPFADAAASRVLVRAIKTSRAPLRLLPPLALHPQGGEAKHTPEVEAILRGEAGLDWLGR